MTVKIDNPMVAPVGLRSKVAEQNELGKSLDALRQIGPLSRAAMDRNFPSGLSADIDGMRTPSDSYLRLFDGALSQYEGVLRLLDEPSLTRAAEPLLRSMIEYAAHVAWIADGVGHTNQHQQTPAVRAMCFEAGAWHALNASAQGTIAASWAASKEQIPELTAVLSPELVRTLEATPNIAVPLNGLDYLVKVIREKHSSTHCTCKGRTANGVQATLKAMMDNEPVVATLYGVYSGTAHHLGPGLGDVFPPRLIALFTADLFVASARRMVASGADPAASADLASALRRATEGILATSDIDITAMLSMAGVIIPAS